VIGERRDPAVLQQVFVSDSIKGSAAPLPAALARVIDSPDIPLNVAAAALQTDRRVRSIGGFVAKKVGDASSKLHRDEGRALTTKFGRGLRRSSVGAMEARVRETG